MIFLPSQCRAARALLEMSQTTLATKAGVSLRTVIGFETGERQTKPGTLQVLRQALEGEGVIFIDGNGPGARLKGLSDDVEKLLELNLGASPVARPRKAVQPGSAKKMPRHTGTRKGVPSARGIQRAVDKNAAAWRRWKATMAAKGKG